MTEDILSFGDILGLIFYLPLIFIISYIIQHRKIQYNSVYKYYTKGLIAKFIGSISFCLVYALHYKGGDTINYYLSSLAMNNMLFYNANYYWDLMTGGRYWYFTMDTGLPAKYMFDDVQTFFVVRLANIFVLMGFKSFITASILLSWISYVGIWRFYLMFTDIYPKLQKQLAYAILFFPSPLFWGSGISKDTFAYASALWTVYNFYMIFIKHKNIIGNIIILIINIFVIINIKPYIFIIILPLILIWVLYYPISKIKGQFLKYMIAPVVLVLGMLIGTLVLNLSSKSLGQYSSYTKIVTKAEVTREDHLREEAYGKNNYNIGEFDGSLRSILKVGPLAIITALYRPFIFEARNFFMLISGIENLILLFLTLMILFKAGLIKAFNRSISEPLLLFSILFSVIFSFGIGVSAANFGALVRFKIPLIPFFTSAIVVMISKHKEEKEMLEQQLKLQEENNIVNSK